MRKIYICTILLIISLTFLLSGCIKVDINTGIDEHFTAFLTYHIEMELDKVDARYREILKNALNRIGWYYQEELDFGVQFDVENNPVVLIMTKRIENSSFEQAFGSLEDLLTNEEITPFMMVDMALDSSERQKRYIFNAETDISQILRLSNYEELSPSLQELLKNAIENGEGNITLTLPNSEVFSHSNEINIVNNQATITVPLSYTEQTSIGFAGVLNFRADGSPAGKLNEIINDLSWHITLSIILCISVIILLLIVYLLTKLSNKK